MWFDGASRGVHKSCVYGFLTSTPHLLVSAAVAGRVLRSLLLTLLLLAASEHLLKEVELSLGDRNEQKKSPEGLAPALQHIECTN